MFALLFAACVPATCDAPSAEADPAAAPAALSRGACPGEAAFADGRTWTWATDDGPLTATARAVDPGIWQVDYRQEGTGVVTTSAADFHCDADGLWLDGETVSRDSGDLVTTTESLYVPARLVLPATLTPGTGWAWPTDYQVRLTNDAGYAADWDDRTTADPVHFVVLGDEVIGEVSAVRVMQFAHVRSAYGYVETVDRFYAPDLGEVLGMELSRAVELEGVDG